MEKIKILVDAIACGDELCMPALTIAYTMAYNLFLIILCSILLFALNRANRENRASKEMKSYIDVSGITGWDLIALHAYIDELKERSIDEQQKGSV